MSGRIVCPRYGSATWPAAPVAPMRMRSPASDCGEPAKYACLLLHGPMSQVAGGSRSVRPSVLTNMPVMRAGHELEVQLPRRRGRDRSSPTSNTRATRVRRRRSWPCCSNTTRSAKPSAASRSAAALEPGVALVAPRLPSRRAECGRPSSGFAPRSMTPIASSTVKPSRRVTRKMSWRSWVNGSAAAG